MGGFFLFGDVYKYIAENFPDILPKGKGKKGKSELTKYGWQACIIEIAKTGILGDVKAVEMVNMWEFIGALSIIRAEQKDIAKAHEQK